MYAGIVLLWIWECGNKARELRRRLVNQEMVNAYYDGVRSYDMLVKRTSASHCPNSLTSLILSFGNQSVEH